MNGIKITADSVKCKYLGKEENSHTKLEAIKIHNEKMKALVEKGEYAKGTLKRFEVVERHVKDYLASQYSKKDLDVKCTDEFIDGFDFYLHTTKRERHQYSTLFGCFPQIDLKERHQNNTKTPYLILRNFKPFCLVYV